MAISKAFIQRQLKKNLPKLNDGYKDCFFTSIPEQTYDSSDGSFDNSELPNQFDLKAIIADFSFTKNQSGFLEQEDTSVLAKDKKAVVESRFFEENGVKPKKDDTFYVIEESVSYNVVGANSDPFKGIYILHLRPENEVIGD